jgi:archaellum component FlaF (FlaF/FlaG flagellin family)
VNARLLASLLVAIGILIVSGIAAPNVRAAPAPTLSIVSPSPNTVIGNGSPVVVVFAVTNFNLTDPGNGTSSPDSGHVDVFVDGGWTTKASVNTIVLPLPSGPHTIGLQLVTDNGSALNPGVSASVAVMVTQGPAGGTPGLAIFFPREGALLGTDSTISFRVTNFVLVAPGGPAGVPNEGHVRVRLDSAYYADLTDDAPLHLNLKDGPHTVTLELVDNAGTPLNPDVTVILHITVQALVGRITPFDATPYLALANILLGLAILAAIYRKLEVD